ncbi:Alpha/Beta hydrolase protein [Fomes fomentarius]|nr:Alpha/Beta hydrolase protein [Fomes fomentarius]
MEGEIDLSVPGISTPCKTWYKVIGDLETSSRRPLVTLHGGPGAISDYLLPLTDLADVHGIPIIFYDQLGNGRSTHLREKNDDTAFWTEELFMDQLNGVLEHLGIRDDYDLLGHSWGGMLGARFAARQPTGLKRLILSNAPASIKMWIEAVNKLRADLPKHVQDVLDEHEQDGTTDSAEYQDAVMVFYKKHLCRIDPFPEEALAVFKALEDDPTVYGTMFGPSEFFVTGPLKEWTVVDELHKINVPTLLLNGRYDEAQDIVVRPFFRHIPNVRWYTFAESSHFPHCEERGKFMEVVGEFLADDP